MTTISNLLFTFAVGRICESISLKEIAFFDLDITSESIQYDGDNNVYWIGNWNDGTIDSITANILALTNSYEAFSANNTFNFSRAISYSLDALSYEENDGIGASGMVVNNGFLYVANTLTGIVSKFNTTSKILVDSYAITYRDTGIAAKTDGLCIDPENPSILYTTDWGEMNETGRQGIWSIDTSDSTIKQIYWYDSTSNQYDLRPNGCVIKNGIMYVVETKPNLSGLLAMYDISTKEWSYDYSLTYMGDGIIIDKDDNIYITAWGNPGDDLSFGNGMIIGKENGKDEWTVLIDGLWSAADMTYDDINNVIVVSDYYLPSNYFRFYSISNDDDDDSDSNDLSSDSQEFTLYAAKSSDNNNENDMNYSYTINISLWLLIGAIILIFNGILYWICVYKRNTCLTLN